MCLNNSQADFRQVRLECCQRLILRLLVQRRLGMTVQMSTAEELTNVATSSDTVTAAAALPIPDLEEPTSTKEKGE